MYECLTIHFLVLCISGDFLTHPLHLIEGQIFGDFTLRFCFTEMRNKLNQMKYRSGTLNSNTVNSKFHLIRSFFEIFARFLLFHV